MLDTLEEQEFNALIAKTRPQSTRLLVEAHEFCLWTIDQDFPFLTESQKNVLAVYHDALCWVLGNDQAALPGILDRLHEVIRQNEEEPAVRPN